VEIFGPAAAIAGVEPALTASLRTPRPTSTPHRKMTTDTTVVAMKRNTSCFPLS
jgi:hypothetical protein